MAKKLTLEEFLKLEQETPDLAGRLTKSALSVSPIGQGSISSRSESLGQKAANWLNDTIYGGGKMAYSPARFAEVPVDWATPMGWGFNSGQMIGEDLNKGDINSAGQNFAMAILPGAGKGKKLAEGLVEGAAKSLTRKAAKTGKNLNVIPEIRDLPVEEAVRIARREPHLIPAGANSPSAYLGAPRSIQNRGDILKMRRNLDKNLADDPRGGDWYDRYRGGVTEVTGGNRKDMDWMTAQHGQYSAGVSPEGELGFAIKDNNANLMGMPTKVARPAQAERARAAIDANDPELHQLGKKTGEYRKKVHPDAGNKRTATGVNDFRWAREFGYTDTTGAQQRDAMGAAQHKFMDYETASTVDRANKAELAGRSDWTGEQIQAAPWVRQKAYALLNDRNFLKDRMKEAKAQAKAAGRKITDEEARAIAYPLAYEDAFQEANKTITEWFPKHTAYATHEAIPGVSTGHLPGMINATPEEKAAYTAAGSWASAPGERDAIYAGLRRGDTGVAGRVRPSLEMQGMWDAEGLPTQYNPGQSARPLVGFNAGKDVKTLADADRAMLQSGETLRAALDAQDAGGAHVRIGGGKTGASRSLAADMNRKLTVDEMKKLKEIGKGAGLPDVVDIGEGVTLTAFGKDMPNRNAKDFKKLQAEVQGVLPGAKNTRRTAVDSVYADLTDAWKKGEGSGAVTDQVLAEISQNPVMRAAYNDNPYIANQALRLLERDEKLAGAKGGVRQDLQNMRRVIAEGGGKGWVDRLEKARKAGQISLPAFGALMLAAKQSQQPAEQ